MLRHDSGARPKIENARNSQRIKKPAPQTHFWLGRSYRRPCDGVLVTSKYPKWHRWVFSAMTTTHTHTSSESPRNVAAYMFYPGALPKRCTGGAVFPFRPDLGVVLTWESPMRGPRMNGFLLVSLANKNDKLRMVEMHCQKGHGQNERVPWSLVGD